jgi:hypothetical protein
LADDIKSESDSSSVIDCESLIGEEDFFGSEFSDHEDDLMMNEKINENLTPDHENIYENSNITMAEFRIAFLFLKQKLNLSTKHTRLVFDFIQSVLPKDNKLSTYNKLVKDFKSEQAPTTKACLICCRPLQPNVECSSSFCISQKKTKNLAKYKDPTCIKFNFLKHFQYVLIEKYDSICTYQGKYNILIKMSFC